MDNCRLKYSHMTIRVNYINAINFLLFTFSVLKYFQIISSRDIVYKFIDHYLI